MEQQPPPPTERSSPPPTPSPSAASTSSLPPLSTPASSTKPTLNPSASTSVTPPSQNLQSRPASEPPSSFATSRQQPSPFQHLAHPPSSLTVPPPARGGLAIGVPAHQPGPSPPPASFSSLAPPSFGQQFGGLGRGVPDSLPTSSSAQGRPVQGMQGIGITGSLGSSMPMRPAGVPPQPVRSITTAIRQQTVTNSQSPSSQNFQGHGMLRAPNPPSTSQSPQSQNQAWLSSGVQGKPPLPPPSLRPQLSQQSLQQRSHIRPQHHHSVPASQQQQHTSSAQQAQPSISSQSQENLGQQIQPSRTQQPFPNQPPIARSHGFGIPRPSSHALLHSAAVQSGPLNKTSAAETEEPCNRILSKRSIQELVTQIDPSEKLDAEVEDILVDIADEFVESLTTFGCSLAKHRKSSTLEAKDILLHAERHWNITLPGFSGDEIRTYKKPLTSDVHRERLAAIKRSSVAVKPSNTKSSAGQGGNSKTTPLGKGPTNILTSPNAKT
ncbi:transcription initiation factor TFIID subunit 12-like [Ipomoea triloba]|uniref:transcription initiation factor TFIID subunit 12-like n=1 Tax=Ipomoea triloba TaxID=35885 RepID=UPI00125D923E|nr:transcription initiation factor TFIID subunit 12-like [Ipomoea triloba]